jgi:cation diffusion facilitator family transporter
VRGPQTFQNSFAERSVTGSESESKGSMVAALAANALIAAMKYSATIFTGSAVLLAEGFHSTADTGNQALLLLGLKRAQRPPDRGHPFGHGKERFFWAFVVAVSLFTVGAALSVCEGTLRLLDGGGSEISLPLALGVLAAAAVFESYAWQKALRRFRREKDDASWWTVLRRTKQPELLTVLLEDSAALVGIAIAATGVVLSHLTGNSLFDGAAAIAVGLLLGIVAFLLGRESKAMLIGEAASAADIHSIELAVGSVHDAESIIDLRTMHLSPDQILVALEVRFAADLDTQGVAEATDRIEDAVARKLPRAKAILVEASTR